MDLRINETRQTGAVGNRTYRVGLNAMRLETEPTGPDKSPIHPRYIGTGGTEQAGSKPRGESVYLFLEFTISVVSELEWHPSHSHSKLVIGTPSEHFRQSELGQF